MLVCLSVGMWRANGNPNPCTDLDKFCFHIPTCPRKVLVQFWTRPPHPPGPRGPETLEAEGHIIENCLQYKRCPAGCKLTRAVLGASASFPIRKLQFTERCQIWKWITESIKLSWHFKPVDKFHCVTHLFKWMILLHLIKYLLLSVFFWKTIKCFLPAFPS